MRLNFFESYSYNACIPDMNKKLTYLLSEGVGIRSSARLLKISKDTVQRKILSIASKIRKPPIKKGRVYELDEMCTYIGSKEKGKYWIAYAIDRKTRKPIDFKVGKRNPLSRI